MIRPILALLLLAASLSAQYALGPNSMRQEGVPQGKVEHFEWTSKIYPGTVRDVWFYVPQQYDGSEPAAVMVFQDGHSFINTEGDRAWMTPVVLDNLIHQGKMPVTIGIFVKWGLLPGQNDGQQGRYNRSFEYDALGDRYARFLIEEILPEAAKKYNLTEDPNLRGVGGSSSGAICAFTAAWHRPDVFRRVLSFVGSYVNLRGGQIYPGLIRKVEPKPLRIFQQDGRNDLDIYSGSWWAANQDMAMALRYAGYEHRWIIGDEGHNNRHGRAILPDALAWLWRDWEEPIQANRTPIGDRHWVLEFADPKSGWEEVSSGHTFTEGPALAPNGDVYFTDTRESKVWKIDAKTQKVSLWKEDTQRSNGLMFGPDGKIYACKRNAKQIVAWDPKTGDEEVIGEGAEPNDIAVTKEGVIYFTEPSAKKVWRIGKDRKMTVAHEGIDRPNGVILSPDQSLLMVADSWGKWVWSFQIQPNGDLANGQPFYRLETSDRSTRSSADGMTVGAQGHLFVTTSEGLQICDQPGRVIGILSKPHAGPLSNVIFAGPDLKTLYVTAGDKVFRRRMRMEGVRPWETRKPPVPRL